MPFNFNPATIRALAKLVQVLDQHRFGAIMLVILAALSIGAAAIAHGQLLA
jgi:hypothetical protein